MAYEERRVVSEPADPAAADGVVTDRVVETAPAERVVQAAPVQPATVIEQRPTTRIVQSDDPIGNVYAATQLIQTIVWSVVVLVLLVVVLVALHVYAGLF